MPPTTIQNSGEKRIFLAEDDIDDQDFLVEALLKKEKNLMIHVESSGEKALRYLEGLSVKELPSLIILDFNLPLVSGQQILETINQNKKFRNIVKIVWSTSNSPFYEKLCLKSGASAYFVKPSDIASLEEVAGKMLSIAQPVPLIQ